MGCLSCLTRLSHTYKCRSGAIFDQVRHFLCLILFFTPSDLRFRGVSCGPLTGQLRFETAGFPGVKA